MGCGCSGSVYPDEAYIGQWTRSGTATEQFTMYIGPNGQFNYQESSGMRRINLNGYLAEFGPTHFAFKCCGCGKRWDIDSPPQLEGRVWTMKLNGVEWTRVQAKDQSDLYR
eukprot:TRINITY_DN14365_c0_g1_i1.p1 TRINITY_DN14365_c0_g1~~TRINITY_DN14365_c0_g1_i1.p1  ORF type:complete len:111 (+),score=8.21 TRINITY_DN14365_c0_g1_i1:36-368(+)